MRKALAAVGMVPEVNLQLFARDTKGNVASIGFGLDPYIPVAANSSVAPAQAAAGRVARTAGADPATRAGDPGTAEAKPWVTPLSSVDPLTKGSSVVSDIDASPAAACAWSLVSDLGTKTVWVGGTYVKATGVTADVEYSNGATSSLGIGVSVSGAFGSFSQSGTASVSSSGSVQFPTHSGFQHVYTQFRYGKYGFWCDSTPGYRKYEARARYWAGGASIFNPSTAPSAPYCVSFHAGTKFRKQTTTAYEFSAGVDISGSIGIDLSSRTGFSSALTNYFVFSSTRRLCGSSDLPGGSPKRLVAQL